MFKYLAISGAGINGLAFVGCLDVLERNGILRHIEGFSGSSAGALVSTLVVMGYKANELKNIMFKVDFGKFVHFDLDTLIKKFGACDGSELIKLVNFLFRNKGLDPSITFKQLYDKTHKRLNITGSCLSKAAFTDKFSKSDSFNYETTPDMKILEALRITISIPWIYSPHTFNNQMYVDGALFHPYPISWFKNLDPEKKYTLGFVSYDIYEDTPTSLDSYSLSILVGMMDQLKMLCVKNYKKQTVILENLESNCFDFGISNDSKELLFKCGVQNMSKHLENIFTERRSVYLSHKYFAKWKNYKHKDELE